MFIQTEQTPNPAVLKFLPGRAVSETGPVELRADQASASPLAEGLFDIGGVDSVFFGDDFISVTRTADGPGWDEIKPGVLAAIMDHFLSGQPLMRGEAGGGSDHAVYDGEAGEIVQEIMDVLDSRIRPAVAQDGGDILFDRYEADTGVLWLVLRGACAGCPSSAATLKSGVENMMRHYVPEVTRVEQAA